VFGEAERRRKPAVEGERSRRTPVTHWPERQIEKEAVTEMAVVAVVLIVVVEVVVVAVVALASPHSLVFAASFRCSFGSATENTEK
jgi:hypothetical protein